MPKTSGVSTAASPTPQSTLASNLKPMQPPKENAVITISVLITIRIQNRKHHLLPPPTTKLRLQKHFLPQPHHFPPRIAKRPAPQRAKHQPPMAPGGRNTQDHPYLRPHELAIGRFRVNLPPVTDATVHRGVSQCRHADDADDGQMIGLAQIQ